jgi:hypothetical protein
VSWRVLLPIIVVVAIALVGVGVFSAGRDAAERDYFLAEGRPFDRGQKYAAPFNSDYDQWWYFAAGAVVVVGASLVPLLARRRDEG